MYIQTLKFNFLKLESHYKKYGFNYTFYYHKYSILKL